MAYFDGKRLTQAVMRLPVEAARRGEFSDKYFENIVTILSGLKASGATYAGVKPSKLIPVDVSAERIGDVAVEAQIFNRRAPYALVGGVDAALALLRYASGVIGEPDADEVWRQLDVEAVQDGVITEYDGHPENVLPVIRIRGRYRDFALLETVILGYLTRFSRIATNVYDVLKAAGGKTILFFPARFDLPEIQAADGYAYWLAVRRYQHEVTPSSLARISTDAQGRWWGGKGAGTVPHALIAVFLGDSAAAMVAFAEHVNIETPRILLADFNNDCARAARKTLDAYWSRCRENIRSGDGDGIKRWTLAGVRLDTAGNLLDASLTDETQKGVSPALVWAVRGAIDSWPDSTGESGDLLQAARLYARNVQIIATGGFNKERIERFEREGVPVDSYGVGSSLLANDKTTGTDFTMDVVRAHLGGEWLDIAKIGRRAGENPDLAPVNLAEI